MSSGYLSVTGYVGSGGGSDSNNEELRTLKIRMNTLLIDFSKLVGTVEGLNSLSGSINDINKSIAELNERVTMIENKLKS